jgi:RNA polymerase sigma factor (sigma-70 family)
MLDQFLVGRRVFFPLENLSRDIAALAQSWVVDHGDYLYSWAQRHGLSTSICEDLVQETLLAGMAGYSKFRGDSSERGWLRAILRNKLVDHLRRTQRENVSPLECPLSDSDHFDLRGKWLTPETPPDEQVYRGQVTDAIRCCLKVLNERSRQLFLLAEIEGIAPQELADASSLTAVNVRVLLHRARLKLRDCLIKQGIQL